MRNIPENENSSNETTSSSYCDQALANHLENVRHKLGLSLNEVSELSSVSRATLSRIERGQTSPTASVLGRLCSVYAMSMSSLLMAVETDSPRHTVFKNAKKWRDPETGYTRIALSPPTEQYAAQVSLGALPTGAIIEYDKPPMEGLEQHIVLLEGQLTLTFDGQTYLLKPKDCLALKLHGSSCFQNMGDTVAEYLIINC